MRLSKSIYKSLGTAAIALSLNACDSSTSNDLGASNLTEGLGATGLITGGNNAGGTGSGGQITGSAEVVNITALTDGSASATVDFTVASDDGFHVQLNDANYSGVSSATVQATDATHAELLLNFSSAADIDAGTYSDSVEVSFCTTSSCDTHLEGSPVTITSNLTVDFVTAAGGEPLLSKNENRYEIETDLFAATYIKKSKVFVAAVNSNTKFLDNPPQTLIFIDPVRKKNGLVGYLPYPATSITADSTGTTPRFVVGHANGWITVVDYNESEPAASISTLLNSGFSLAHIAVNATDVYAIPAAGGADLIRRIDISTNQYGDYAGVEVPAGSALSAHADGGSVYVAAAGDGGAVQNFSITEKGIAHSHTAINPGAYDLCNGIWSNVDSTQMITGCGYVFSSSSTPAEDMLYLGRVDPPYVDSLVPTQKIVDVADSQASTEMMTISKKLDACGANERCPYTVNFYNKSDYSHITSRAFGAFLAGDDEPVRLEYPVAAGYSEAGDQLYVVTRLEEMSSAIIDVEKAYLHIIER